MSLVTFVAGAFLGLSLGCRWDFVTKCRWLVAGKKTWGAGLILRFSDLRCQFLMQMLKNRTKLPKTEPDAGVRGGGGLNVFTKTEI